MVGGSLSFLLLRNIIANVCSIFKNNLYAFVKLNNNLAVQTGTITASSGFTIAPTNTYLAKSGKVVALQLVISASGPINTTTIIAMLPNGFWPAYPINYMCRGSNSQFNADGIMYLYISTDGGMQVRPKAGESYTFVAINCSFIVN